MYRQSCPCRGRALSASRDCARYEREAEDLTRAIIGLTAEQKQKNRSDPSIAEELVRLERDRSFARQNRHKAFRRLLEPYESCAICSNTGYRDSPGTIGGYGRTASNVQRAEKVR